MGFFKKRLLIGLVEVLFAKWMGRSDKMLSLPQGLVRYPLVRREICRGQLRVQLPWELFWSRRGCRPRMTPAAGDSSSPAHRARAAFAKYRLDSDLQS